MISIPFFLNTWEEYYTGALNFPIIHGVSEGNLIACIAMNLSGAYGLEFWLTKYTLFNIEMPLNQWTVLSCFISGVGFGINSLINVFQNYEDKRDDAITNLVIFFAMNTSLAGLINFADSQIVREYPKIILILYGFAFAKLVGHLQLAHLADAKFMQYRKSLLITFFWLLAFSLVEHFFKLKIVNIDLLIIIFTIMHIIVWMHFAYYLTEELCETLGIYRFIAGKRQKKE